MKILLNTNLIPMFNGTYCTEWELERVPDDDGNEAEIEYDPNDLMRSIAETYRDNEADILKQLKSPFVRGLHFTGKTFSPREYNFRTDELDFEVDVNTSELIRTLESLKDNGDFAKFLQDNFSSYDGFLSFTPNNYRDIVHEIKTQGDEFHQSISAVIRFLAGDNLRHINGDMWSEWVENGYGGLEYKIV